MLLGAFVLLIVACNAYVILSTSDRVFDRTEDVPSGGVGLVLGTLPAADFFDHRLDAGGALWKAGRVKGFVVSGDGSVHGKEQIRKMREGLVARGVPSAVIQVDPAGFRTLDSLARFKFYAGESPVVIVTQKFHNHRSLLLADHFGVKGCGFNAEHSSLTGHFVKSEVREVLARVKLLLDLYVLDTQPREPVPARVSPAHP